MINRKTKRWLLKLLNKKMKLPKHLIATDSLADKASVWVIRNEFPRFLAKASPRNNCINLHVAAEIDPLPEESQAAMSRIMSEAAMFVQEKVGEPVRKDGYSYVTGSKPETPEFLVCGSAADEFCGVIYTKFPPAIIEIERSGKGISIIEFNATRVLTDDKIAQIVEAAKEFITTLI